MTNETTLLWKTIFKDITNDSGYYQMGEVNFYQLASHLEELYIQNADLCDRIEQLEKEVNLLKSYAWEQ